MLNLTIFVNKLAHKIIFLGKRLEIFKSPKEIKHNSK
jgi:hypothetical protein